MFCKKNDVIYIDYSFCIRQINENNTLNQKACNKNVASLFSIILSFYHSIIEKF